MKLETGKEMDRRCVLGWLNEVYRNPTMAFITHSDEQLIEFAHDALVFLKEQDCNCCGTVFDVAYKAGKADAVVRCKDCKHRSKELYDYYGNKNDKRYVCQINDLAKNPDWFCADGVRKDETNIDD